MAKVVIKRDKHKGHTVSFAGLTLGEILSIKNALDSHALTSPVGEDVKNYLANGISECPDEMVRNLLTE